MRKLDKILSVNKPKAIQPLGNNSYYYNYNITPSKVYENIEDNKEEKDGWAFTPIYIKGTPNYENCVKNIIRCFISQDEEFDLINSYNKTIIMNTRNIEVEKEYKEYLNLLDSIKEEVKQSFNK